MPSDSRQPAADDDLSLDVQFLTRAGCGLCDAMERELDRATAALGITFRQVDVDTDPELAVRYGDDVPVILVNGEKAFEHRASAEAIRARLVRQRT